MKTIVQTQFTGNAKLYAYLLPEEAPSGLNAVSPGDRIVVINKIAEDGKVSLSMATIISVHEVDDKDATDLKPFVQLVPKSAIDVAVAAHQEVKA